MLVPLLREHVNPLLIKYLGWTGLFADDNPTGLGYVSAAVILAIMILPIISSLTREVMTAVPHSQREAVLALGATRWEMIRMGVLRNARIGIVGAVILGLGRALGETMAVTMVIGNTPEISKSLLANGTSMASVIANEFAEAVERSASQRADRDRTGAVYRDDHRECIGAAAGVGGDARRAGKSALKEAGDQDQELGTRDRAGTTNDGDERHSFRSGMPGDDRSRGERVWRCLPRLLVIVPLVAIFVYLVYKGASSLNLDFFTKNPVPVGESGGGMANAIVGSGVLLGIASVDRHSHWHWRRHLSGGIRARDKAGQCDPLHRRRAQWRAVDRDGRGGLFADRDSAASFLGLFGWRGAGHHDDSHGHAHHAKRCC